MKRPRTAQQQVEEVLHREQPPDGYEDEGQDKWYHDHEEDDDDQLVDVGERRVGSLRAANADLGLGERYAGKSVSRKRLRVENGDDDEAELGHLLEAGDDDSDNKDDDEDDDDVGDDDLEGNLEGDLEDDDGEVYEYEAGDAALLRRSSTSTEACKGEAIRNQQKVFEKLLGLRIQLQKLMTRLNRFPEAQCLEETLSQDILAASNLKLKETQANLAKLTQLLDELKERQVSDKKDSVSFRDQVLNKWSERTRITSNNLKKNNSSSVVMHLRTTLEDNMDHLVRRTRVQRSDYRIMGTKTSSKTNGDVKDVKNDDELVDIFDDDDFYHLLLRDLISQKTSDTEDGVGATMLWLQMQRNNRKKKRSNVDTRASKGRKLRYDIHAKLVNFMAPIYSKEVMSDVARNELFGSLFGNQQSYMFCNGNKEDEDDNVNENMSASEDDSNVKESNEEEEQNNDNGEDEDMNGDDEFEGNSDDFDGE